MKEYEDDPLKNLLQNDGEEIKAPEGFTDGVMNKIEALSERREKPLFGWPARIFLLVIVLGLAIVSFLGTGEIPAESWVNDLEVQSGLTNSIAFIQEYALIGLLIVTILTFILLDKFLRSKKFTLK
jgi:polyferredoxin